MSILPRDLNYANMDLPEAVENGPINIDYCRWLIVIDGNIVDEYFGNCVDAWECYHERKRELAEDPTIDLETPFDELYEDDTYWRNGHIEPLRLEDDEPIPWQGEPCGDDGYGLEAVA